MESSCPPLIFRNGPILGQALAADTNEFGLREARPKCIAVRQRGRCIAGAFAGEEQCDGHVEIEGGGDHEEEKVEEEEEEEEPKLTYDEEYEDEDKHKKEEVEEEEEVEVEKKDPTDTENGAMKKERSPQETSSVSNTEGGDRDGDYLEDLPTNQDDNTYYYYDEYENGNHTRYDSADEHLDYVDTESEEEDVTPGNSAELEPDILEKRDEDTSHRSTSNSSRIVKEKVGSPISSMDLEQGSSMEGSDKMFSMFSASEEQEFEEKKESEENEEYEEKEELEEKEEPEEKEEKEKPENVSSETSSILIGGAVVSVVTTKSVVNGTISVPTTASPATTKQVAPPPPSSSPSSSSSSVAEITEGHPEVTTEDSARILASVQTSRSISGARFLPFPVIDRVEQVEAHGGSLEGKKTSQSPSESTESIIDKLDWAQSKLSSDLLPAAILGTGGFRNAGNTLQLDVLAERDRTTTSTTTTRKSFTTTAKVPVIGKFVPRRYNDKRVEHTSTAKPRFETTIDNLEGLLPRNYVSRGTTPSAVTKINFRWPSSKLTTSTDSPTQTKTPSTTSRTKPNTSIVVQDISAFLPPGYKLKKEDATATESSLLSEILAKSEVDISSLLPSDYNKKKEESKPKDITTTTAKSTGVSPEKIASSFQDLFASSKVDISALLPKDYEQKKKDLVVDSKAVGNVSSEQNATVTERTDSESPTTKKTGGLKIVFPSRPGGRKPIQKITTPLTLLRDGPGAVTPKIQKGWPTRATTEFTGWPTPSTTPISIEKLLEAARTATVASTNISLIPSTNEISSTSSTSTTTTTPRPTTPGVCDDECEVAGTIRIIGNATWVPELFDRNTREWQELANQVEREMNFIFSKSSVLMNWFKNIRIDSFSQGSILVDYFVELANLRQKVNTQELKVIFHDSLRTYNANRWNETSMKGPLKMGMFTIDPKYTDFVVIPKVNTPQYIEKDDRLIPQWAIAVIVIGVGGLLFIIVFGVSVLVNRQSGSKLKPTMSAIYEEEVAKHTSSHRSSDYSKPVHTIWTDPDVSWNDKSFESTSNKILVDKSFQDNKKYNLYDSWRSEWNGYYYNPSHASSKYGGYDSTTNLSSRHHPDYDTNF
ncbi:flocculation protein FLO11 [Pogonomyrmex barbatus]|uniref:Flocculation protein FLO11 n=1 Tax=Pogonomyrmex barbatus TaxID=144034 RepID=A0A8N1S9K7_9HYME|nr:flocculation protein FLO11 [Pogonomyrmex barbatus]